MRVLFAFFVLTGTTYAGIESLGPNGIDATGLLLPNGNVLTGAGINLGQVEIGRPGKPGFDNSANSTPQSVRYRFSSKMGLPLRMLMLPVTPKKLRA